MKTSQVRRTCRLDLYKEVYRFECFFNFNILHLGLTKQLNQPGISLVTSVLERAKSSYLPPFLKLSQQIKVYTDRFMHNADDRICILSSIFTCTLCM